MTFYIQHGYGKGNKIQLAQATGAIAGIVLSPADEDPANLRATADLARGLGLDVLLDPQTYLYAVNPNGTARHHASHGIDFPELSWSEDAATLQRQIESVGRMQESINPLGLWIAPSALQTSFTDIWTPLSLQLGRTASSEWGPGKTLATIAIDESAFSTYAAIEDWLNVATTLDVRGFYLVVQRASTQYPPVAWAPERLANLLRLVYTLTVLNGYELRWGYSDAEGLLGVAAGATSFGAGWSFGLRQFSTDKWIPKSGGSPATIRIPMSKLWTSVRAGTSLGGEALDLWNSSFRGSVFTSQVEREFPLGDFTTVNRSEVQDIFLRELAVSASRLAALSISDRLDWIQTSLTEARQLYAQISRAGIQLEPKYAARAAALLKAVQLFRDAESL